ncbi:MAG: DUF2442 domain-containing protein [Chitinophagaceae bacterium]
MSILTINKSNKAFDVSFNESKMILFIEDGREIAFPLEWFPKLKTATPEQLKKWRLIGEGEGIHWEELDEDISVEKLLE